MSERRCMPALSHLYSQCVQRSPRNRVTMNSKQAKTMPCHVYGLFISTDLISHLHNENKKSATTGANHGDKWGTSPPKFWSEGTLIDKSSPKMLSRFKISGTSGCFSLCQCICILQYTLLHLRHSIRCVVRWFNG